MYQVTKQTSTPAISSQSEARILVIVTTRQILSCTTKSMITEDRKREGRA